MFSQIKPIPLLCSLSFTVVVAASVFGIRWLCPMEEVPLSSKAIVMKIIHFNKEKGMFSNRILGDNEIISKAATGVQNHIPLSALVQKQNSSSTPGTKSYL